MSTRSKEFAAVMVTAVGAVVGWAYLIAQLAMNLAYPTLA